MEWSAVQCGFLGAHMCSWQCSMEWPTMPRVSLRSRSMPEGSSIRLMYSAVSDAVDGESRMKSVTTCSEKARSHATSSGSSDLRKAHAASLPLSAKQAERVGEGTQQRVIVGWSLGPMGLRGPNACTAIRVV